MSLLKNLLDPFLLGLWVLLWSLGGWWLVRAAFKLQPHEEAMLGLVVGLTAEVSLANFIARILPLPAAAWVSAGLVLGLGWIFSLRRPGLLRLPIFPLQWLALAGVMFVFFSISSGLAIFDDYAHLPTLSLMAAGQIPPHFAYNPQVNYGYHYFLLLLAAQAMRVCGWFPWTALDAARVLSLGLAVITGGLWARRVTRSSAAGLLGGISVLFATGTRWLLLLLPPDLLDQISTHTGLLGSGGQSGPTLAKALMGGWAMEGGGPFPFPFAFANGIIPPGAVTVLNSTGLMMMAILFTLLLTTSRWRDGLPAGIISVLLLSATGLLGEVEIALLSAGWGLVTLGWWLSQRSLRLPETLRRGWLVWIASAAVIAVQGGAWTDTLTSLARRLLTGAASTSYQTVGFKLAGPALVSSHLGVLRLTDYRLLLAALLEAGPLLFVLPLAAAWGWKAFRARRWFEAALVSAALLSLGLLFVQFSGSTGVRNTSRLYLFFPICLILSVPLAWLWASHRSGSVKSIALLLAALSLTGGVVLFGTELPAAQKPVYSYFIEGPDVRMEKALWNQLEPDALVFDPITPRAVTLFARFTNAAFTWYTFKPEYSTLVSSPNPHRMQELGFTYLYLDKTYWDKLTPARRVPLQDACLTLVKEESDKGTNWRRLYDLRACK